MTEAEDRISLFDLAVLKALAKASDFGVETLAEKDIIFWLDKFWQKDIPPAELMERISASLNRLEEDGLVEDKKEEKFHYPTPKRVDRWEN